MSRRCSRGSREENLGCAVVKSYTTGISAYPSQVLRHASLVLRNRKSTSWRVLSICACSGQSLGVDSSPDRLSEVGQIMSIDYPNIVIRNAQVRSTHRLLNSSLRCVTNALLFLQIECLMDLSRRTISSGVCSMTACKWRGNEQFQFKDIAFAAPRPDELTVRYLHCTRPEASTSGSFAMSKGKLWISQREIMSLNSFHER